MGNKAIGFSAAMVVCGAIGASDAAPASIRVLALVLAGACGFEMVREIK